MRYNQHMSLRLHEKIRQVLETTEGLTQRGLAEHMGIDPAAVNRMLYGRRNIMAEEIPLIEEYLGAAVTLSPPEMEYRQADRASHRPRGMSDVPAESFVPAVDARMNMVPVYGYAAGSPKKGLHLMNGEAIDWAPRHPAQYGIRDAFAVYVFSDSMEPRYFQGELVYVHPGRPPEMNRDCVIELQNGDAYIKRFLKQSEDKIRVIQFNPLEEREFLKSDIKAIYAVVGRG